MPVGDEILLKWTQLFAHISFFRNSIVFESCDRLLNVFMFSDGWRQSVTRFSQHTSCASSWSSPDQYKYSVCRQHNQPPGSSPLCRQHTVWCYRGIIDISLRKSLFLNLMHSPFVWLGGQVVRTLDLRSGARGFKPWPCRCQVQPWVSC